MNRLLIVCKYIELDHTILIVVVVGQVVSRRIVGCQSTNHTECYGILWQCTNCGKRVCCAEGSDNHPELCDDCWVVFTNTQSQTTKDDDEL